MQTVKDLGGQREAVQCNAWKTRAATRKVSNDGARVAVEHGIYFITLVHVGRLPNF